MIHPKRGETTKDSGFAFGRGAGALAIVGSNRIRLLALCGVLAAQLLAAGCAAMRAAQNLPIEAALAEGTWQIVRLEDFPGPGIKGARPSNLGGNLLRDTYLLYEDCADVVDTEARPPSAIRVRLAAATVELAYPDAGTIYTVVVGRGRPPDGAPVDRRTLTDLDRDVLEPARVLRRRIEAQARIDRIGRRLVLALPVDLEETGVGHAMNFITVPISPLSIALFGVGADQRGRIIAWVNPESPANAVLEPGWVLREIDGRPLDEAAEREVGAAPLELLLAHEGKTRSVVFSAEPWPMQVGFHVADWASATAASGPRVIAIAARLLDDLKSDDEVAFVIAHELAHLVHHDVDKEALRDNPYFRAGVLMPLAMITQGLSQGFVRVFDREQERAADRAAVHYMYTAGYDPNAAFRVLETLSILYPRGANDDFLSTHPSYGERRSLVEAEIVRLRDLQ